MILLPTTIITCRLLTNARNSWCIVMIIVIATEARAQDLEKLTDTNNLPPQVLKGMEMFHKAYRFDAFDCEEPEDVLTQSIPHRCSMKALDGKELDTNTASKQDYTILQRVATFEYSATLCTLRRSRSYYDCVWKSHVRIAVRENGVTIPATYRQDQGMIADFGTLMFRQD